MSRPGPSNESAEYPRIHPGGSLILAWQLKGKKVLIVGGGQVAAGRLVNVKDADANLTVIAPSSGLCAEMRYRIEAEQVVDTYHDREFSGESDLDGFEMVLTAIDDVTLSREICEMCRKKRIPVNVADVPPECDFYFGSLIRNGPLQIMVSTGGKGPKIANQVRRRIEASLPPNVGQAIERVGRLRAELRKKAPDTKLGARRMRWMIDVCEKWNLDELCQMSEQDMTRILEGWDNGTVPGYVEVKGTCPILPSPPRRAALVPSASTLLSGFCGFAIGAAAASALWLARPSR